MSQKIKCGIIGATGMVGQRFITLLENHPYFEIAVLAASSGSAGKTYEEAVGSRWKLAAPMPEKVKNMVVMDAAKVEEVSALVDFVFCAVNMPKDQILALEEAYAKAETPVVSNNSANRWTPDVPMVIPEINPEHLEVIAMQKKRLGTTRGFIAVKPNCSIQSFVPAVTPLRQFGITKATVTTFQAISGAGKTFKDWPEMNDNVIPYIGGEEEKTEKEPLKIWGKVDGAVIKPDTEPVISAQCIRVPVSDGHLAAVSLSFTRIKPSVDEIINIWREYKGEPQILGLPSAPSQFITYFEEFDHPQTGVDRMIGNGMGISVGRLRNDPVFDYKFVCLSHNTLRGAAGGAVLIAEMLYRKGYIQAK
ncbi:MAG: aspartate-semialdehyde dehydrogenase [Ruminococcaceae bacterium]|nr:aspartate-semialdehyde dehydrogenase [Oscillospiraceae bacterium]